MPAPRKYDPEVLRRAVELVKSSELLTWSAKAGDLIRNKYAAVGAAARAAVPPAVQVLELAAARGLDVGGLLELQQARATDVQLFSDAYRRYCWPTEGLDGVAIAPFQVLASAGQTFHTREQAWHLAVADRLAEADPELVRRVGNSSTRLPRRAVPRGLAVTHRRRRPGARGWPSPRSTHTLAGSDRVRVRPRRRQPWGN